MISDEDYLPDDGLAAIERLIERMPHGFSLGSCQVRKTSATLTIRFDEPEDVLTRAALIPLLFQAAMCADTLAKNLRAERVARSES